MQLVGSGRDGDGFGHILSEGAGNELLKVVISESYFVIKTSQSVHIEIC